MLAVTSAYDTCLVCFTVETLQMADSGVVSTGLFAFQSSSPQGSKGVYPPIL